MVQSGFYEQPRKIDLLNTNWQLYNSEVNEVSQWKVVAFKLYNFKAFENTDWIDINRLTLFLGDNSAGKSALYLVIRLIRKCYDALSHELYFSDFGEVKEITGKFVDAHNKNSGDNKIHLSFLLENVQQPEEKSVYQVEMIPAKEHEYGVVSSVTIENGLLGENLLNYYDSQNLFFLSRKEGIEVPLEIEKSVKQVMDALRLFAGQIRAISYHRHMPERQMTFTGSTKESVEANGSNAYEMLVQLAQSNPEREKKINDWLDKFGYRYQWAALDKNIGEFLLVNAKTGKSSNIVDNGLGISQSLPIAVELSDLKGKTILLDTPEAFLQTRMQSEMGDLLIEGAKTGNVLAETGSEYVVLRIQRRIAEKAIDKKDVSMYFIYDDEISGSAVCQKLEMNQYGEFMNEPEKFKDFFSSDFFDMQAMSNMKMQQMRKTINADSDRH